MGKPGRDGAPSPVNPGDSAIRREVQLGGPPTRTRWGEYHLARPGGRKASSTRKIKPQTSDLRGRGSLSLVKDVTTIFNSLTEKVALFLHYLEMVVSQAWKQFPDKLIMLSYGLLVKGTTVQELTLPPGSF